MDISLDKPRVKNMSEDHIISVIDEVSGIEYYGGDQAWFESRRLKDYACGVIALTNCILTKELDNASISKARFMHLAEKLQKWYLPVVPGFGINGLELAFGANAYFIRNGLPHRAFWGCLPSHIWETAGKMLDKGWPVVLAIGPNNRILTGKESVAMTGNVNDKARAHYVTITNMTKDKLAVSSWGKKFDIDKAEYEKYMKRTSNPLFSNILVIK